MQQIRLFLAGILGYQKGDATHNATFKNIRRPHPLMVVVFCGFLFWLLLGSITNHGLSQKIKSQNSFYDVEYLDVWRNQTSFKKPFGGINTLEPLIYITPNNTRGYPFFKYVFETMGLRVTDQYEANWTMCFGDRYFQPTRYSDQRMNRINFFHPICSKVGLCESLWHNVETMHGTGPILMKKIGKIDFTPPCFKIPEDWNLILQYSKILGISLRNADDSNATLRDLGRRRLPKAPAWAFKADNTFGGVGVFALKSLGELVPPKNSKCLSVQKRLKNGAFAPHPKECNIPTGVIQTFTQNNMLIYGKRFIFRVYVLVDSLNPFRVFISRAGFVTIGSVPEDESMTSLETHPMCPWIINAIFHGVACKQPDDLVGGYVEDYIQNGQNTSVYDRRCSYMWSLDGMEEHLRETRPDVPFEKVWKSVRTAVAKAVLQGYPYTGERTRYLPRTDQLLMGLDLTIFDDGTATVLEINCHPSMSTHGHLNHLIKRILLEDTVRITGMTQYHYEENLEDEAEEAVDSFCQSQPSGCSDALRITLRDTDLMMSHRGRYELLLPGPEAEPEYDSILAYIKFTNDQLLRAFLKYRGHM